MKFKWKQSLCGLLAGTMLVSTMSTTTAFAADNTTSSCIETTAVQVHSLPPVQESDYTDVASPTNLGTKVVKEAIEFIIKHADEAAKVIEKVAGKTVAKNFLKYFDKIAGALKPLLEWADIPAQAVYDAVYNVLYSSGVSSSVAANIALAIKEGLSWFI